MVGLGNPGQRYEATRHNIGFRVVERLARTIGPVPWRDAAGPAHTAVGAIGDRLVVLAKPLTYMNLSGTAVAILLERMKLDPESLIVVHDDLDLPFGALRVRPGGGHGGHNGIRSLLSELGTADFLRLKLGVGRPPDAMDPAQYVLEPFLKEEGQALDGFVERAAQAIEAIIEQGAQQAMNRFHTQREK